MSPEGMLAEVERRGYTQDELYELIEELIALLDYDHIMQLKADITGEDT